MCETFTLLSMLLSTSPVCAIVQYLEQNDKDTLSQGISTVSLLDTVYVS
jgi:hypothetical protein